MLYEHNYPDETSEFLRLKTVEGLFHSVAIALQAWEREAQICNYQAIWSGSEVLNLF